MIDTILSSMLATLGKMVASPIVPIWFIVSALVTCRLVMVVNDLDWRRVRYYMLLFFTLFVISVGPVLHYEIGLLHIPVNTPGIWAWPTFMFSLYFSLAIGVLSGRLIKIGTEFFFDDFHLSLAAIAFQIGETHLKQSKVGVKSVSELTEKAAQKQASEATTQAVTNTRDIVGAAVELNIVAKEAAIHLKEVKP